MYPVLQHERSPDTHAVQIYQASWLQPPHRPPMYMLMLAGIEITAAVSPFGRESFYAGALYDTSSGELTHAQGW